MGQTLDQYNAADAQVADALHTLLRAAANRNADGSRRLVTVRCIDALDPIIGADAIEVATVDGWKVVVKKGEFSVGDPCVYFEIDCFLPTGNEAWQFLVDKQARSFNGVTGHRLRTVKLRGQVSQGLVLSLPALPEALYALGADGPIPMAWAQGASAEQLARVQPLHDAFKDFTDPTRPDRVRQLDLSDLLGVVKYEPPLPAQLAGQAIGHFPPFIRKTDQERCQNLGRRIFGYDLVKRVLDVPPERLTPEALESGRVVVEDGVAYAVTVPEASRDDRYEVTIKLDGSSATFFHRDGEVGVCSRNLQLKVSEANAGNAFVRMLLDSGLADALPKLGNVAVQGELMGPNIQGNREGLSDFAFFIFDVQELDTGTYLTPVERASFYRRLLDLGVGVAKVQHVPVLHASTTMAELGIADVGGLLQLAEGPSLKHQVREGLVFKRVDGKFSFKAISNQFLLKEKD